jgi:hypothetical protein
MTEIIWFPYVFATTFLCIIVGGRLMHTVLSEFLPVLRRMLEERHGALAGAERRALQEEVVRVSERLELLERGHRELGEQTDFLQNLLARDSESDPALPRR